MSFSIISAVGKNLEIGKKGGLCFNIPGDLKYFKKTTNGHKMIMGYNTFKSLPKVLPNRESIVLCNDDVDLPKGVVQVRSIEEIRDKYENLDEEVFVIGGGRVYAQMVPYAQKLYLTEVDAEDKNADTFFPSFDKSEFTRKVVGSGADGKLNYDFVIYEREEEL
jgi:dihydrofolate reductase